MDEVVVRLDEDGPRNRLATIGDLPILARIHKIAYSTSHFTALLPDQVLMRYYGHFLDRGAEICLALGKVDDGAPGAVAAEEVQGFAVYGMGIPDRIGAFKRECFKEILLASLRHPWIAVRKTLVAAFAKFTKRPPYQPAEFLLLSIAVAAQRRGVGRCLLHSMLRVARQRGCRTVGLYVNADNVSAINAYFAAGFVMMDYRSGQFYMERNLDQA